MEFYEFLLFVKFLSFIFSIIIKVENPHYLTVMIFSMMIIILEVKALTADVSWFMKSKSILDKHS